jgi:hypothetical protein
MSEEAQRQEEPEAPTAPVEDLAPREDGEDVSGGHGAAGSLTEPGQDLLPAV